MAYVTFKNILWLLGVLSAIGGTIALFVWLLGLIPKRKPRPEQPPGPPPTPEKPAPKIHNLPYRPNQYFTGRTKELQDVHDALASKGAAALSGVGGVGKTQIALKYACDHFDDYAGGVYWVQAASRADVVSGFAVLAEPLGLSLGEEKDQELIAVLVKARFERTEGWLLVFDSADRPELIKEFLPGNPKGHILLTSQAQVFDVLNIADPVEVREMPPDDASDFLFRRTEREKGMVAEEERSAAAKLAEELGYFPLALEQAGAYVLAKKVRFQDYLRTYLNQRRRLKFLEIFTPRAGDYSKTITTTWKISCREVRRASKASADLLKVSAFLSPDAIPFELFVLGAPKLGRRLSKALAGAANEPTKVNDLLEPLTRYSLVRIDPDGRTYTIHRLVQEVLRDRMFGLARARWAERAVRVVNAAFPEVEFKTWPLCDRLIAHAKAAAGLVETYRFDFEEAGRLLNQAGYYLRERARYAEAEPLYRRALEIVEKALGPEHPDVAASLNNLALLYHRQGRYAEAEPLYRRALEIREKVLGPEHPGVATSLNNLAALYYSQGRYAEAEPLYRRAREILEKALGPEHPDVAASLNNLALLYDSQGRYAEAEPLLRRAREIREKTLGLEHPNVATSLNNLAELYRAQGRYAEAEPLYRRALEISEKALGPEHPNVATSLNNLAALYRAQGRYGEAEPLFRRALEIWEKALGPEHPNVATVLENYAIFLRKLNRPSEAAELKARAGAIRAKHAAQNPPGES